MKKNHGKEEKRNFKLIAYSHAFIADTSTFQVNFCSHFCCVLISLKILTGPFHTLVSTKTVLCFRFFGSFGFAVAQNFAIFSRNSIPYTAVRQYPSGVSMLYFIG